jgi:hypothetical protein
MSEFAITAQVIDRVSYGLGLAPERISKTVIRRFYTERNQFVGKKKGKVAGSFTRSVMSIRRRSRPGKIPINVAGLFRGMVRTPDVEKNVNGLTMTMGILKDNPKPFVRGIMQLQKGYTRMSGKFMPIPVYKNLEKAGITGGFYSHFRKMAEADDLVTILTGGQVLFISKEMVDNGADVFDATLFVGAKRITARPQNFQFLEKWKARWPGFLTRLDNAIKKEIRSIETGRVKAK